jgi:hypothetical protein
MVRTRENRPIQNNSGHACPLPSSQSGAPGTKGKNRAKLTNAAKNILKIFLKYMFLNNF